MATPYERLTPAQRELLLEYLNQHHPGLPWTYNVGTYRALVRAGWFTDKAYTTRASPMLDAYAADILRAAAQKEFFALKEEHRAQMVAYLRKLAEAPSRERSPLPLSKLRKRVHVEGSTITNPIFGITPVGRAFLVLASE